MKVGDLVRVKLVGGKRTQIPLTPSPSRFERKEAIKFSYSHDNWFDSDHLGLVIIVKKDDVYLITGSGAGWINIASECLDVIR